MRKGSRASESRDVQGEVGVASGARRGAVVKPPRDLPDYRELEIAAAGDGRGKRGHGVPPPRIHLRGGVWIDRCERQGDSPRCGWGIVGVVLRGDLTCPRVPRNCRAPRQGSERAVLHAAYEDVHVVDGEREPATVGAGRAARSEGDQIRRAERDAEHRLALVRWRDCAVADRPGVERIGAERVCVQRQERERLGRKNGIHPLMAAKPEHRRGLIKLRNRIDLNRQLQPSRCPAQASANLRRRVAVPPRWRAARAILGGLAVLDDHGVVLRGNACHGHAVVLSHTRRPLALCASTCWADPL
ncbi:hypothetical protein EBQ81_00480 [bacterium]|nr:hypothetical protein [bacterium]